MSARPQRKTTSKKATASPPGRKKAPAAGRAASAAASIPEGYAIGPYGELIALEDLGLVAGSPAPPRKET
ncbi:MAG: hypothetical protein KGK07_13325 [Chloroflexota bacterium]|nr:hypothetical protein [Chloroflexota bacterium]